MYVEFCGIESFSRQIIGSFCSLLSHIIYSFAADFSNSLSATTEIGLNDACSRATELTLWGTGLPSFSSAAMWAVSLWER